MVVLTLTIDDGPLGGIERSVTDGEIRDLVFAEQRPGLAVRAADSARRDRAHAGHVLVGHPLAAAIRFAQKRAVDVECGELGAIARFGRRLVFACSNRLQSRDVRVARGELEPRLDQRHPVEDSGELGRLVNHVHRRRDLAAVVQQRGKPELPPLGLAHVVVGERPGAGAVSGFGEHHRQLRNAPAMTARVRALLVDRVVDQPHQAFE